MRIGLVGCALKKKPGAHPAKDAYVSRTFDARKAYVKRTCDKWYIMSGRYGLIEPDHVIEGYDDWIRHWPAEDRNSWQLNVAVSIMRLSPTHVEMHAGAHYYDPILAITLQSSGIVVDMPTKGLSIGRTFSWLKHQLESGSV